MAYLLSRKARADFAEIYDYSLHTFGESRADKYMSNLQDGFDLLVAHPHAGKVFDDFPDIRCLVRDSHTIFYRSDLGTILIIRILRHSLDPLRHL